MSTTQTLLADKLTVMSDLAEQSAARLDVDSVLGDLAALAQTVESATRTAVTVAREKGASWAEVGAMLGVSGQAAHKRFSR